MSGEGIYPFGGEAEGEGGEAKGEQHPKGYLYRVNLGHLRIGVKCFVIEC